MQFLLTKMKKYEAYKNSGVKWIGEIPEGWSVVPLKHYLSLKGRIGWNGLKSEEFLEKSYAYLVTGQDFNSDIVNWEKCYQINKERYDEDPFIQLENGDLLVTKDGTIGKVAKVVNLNKPACLNSGIFVVKQTKGVFEQNYLYWVLVSNQLKEFVGFNSTGSTIAHLYQNVFENMPLTVPPLSEQQAIASYLDHKVGQIDASVSAINDQINDLKAYRQSIISEAVTKGLKPDVKMKDSGIEWIGEIPEEWDCIKLGWIYSSMGSGTTPDTNNLSYYSEEGVNWLQTGDLNDGEITSTSKHITDLAVQERGMKIYPSGSVVIAMYGATIGKVGLLSIDTTTNQACCVLPTVDKMWNRYTFYLMQSSKASLISKSVGGGQPNISQAIIKEHKIPVPPLSEQRAIADYLDKKTFEIDSAISSLEAQRNDLNALKQSIISEAVTGKIDLRDWKQKN